MAGSWSPKIGLAWLEQREAARGEICRCAGVRYHRPVRAARGRTFCTTRTRKDGRPATEPPARWSNQTMSTWRRTGWCTRPRADVIHVPAVLVPGLRPVSVKGIQAARRAARTFPWPSSPRSRRGAGVRVYPHPSLRKEVSTLSVRSGWKVAIRPAFRK